MSKIKVTMIQHLSGVESYEKGKEYSFEENEAFNLIVAGIAKAKTQKEHDDLFKKVEAKKEAELQKEKELAALLEKESLEAERENLQKRVDAITDILGDSKTYNK